MVFGNFPPKKQQHGRRRRGIALVSPLGALRGAAEQLGPKTWSRRVGQQLDPQWIQQKVLLPSGCVKIAIENGNL